MSKLGRPSTIHSAIIFPTPGPSLTHTASAAQNPLTFGDSPITGIESAVTESNPLNPNWKGACSRIGITSMIDAIATSKCSGVKGIIVGEYLVSSCGWISSASVIMGGWLYDPISQVSNSCLTYIERSWSRRTGHSI